MQLGLNNAEGGTPLIRAVQSGDVRLVDVVIEAGASPGQPCGCAGAESALWAAAHFGYTEIAARLVAAGAEPDAAAFGGVTPLIVAAQRGHHEIADLLLAAGADPGIADPGGRTAGDWSARRDRGSPPHRPGALLATGVRALDLFAPVRRGSTQWWPAAWELGQFALLTELVRAIEPREFWQIGFATGPYDEESGRQWTRQFPVVTELRLTERGAPADRRAHFAATVNTVAASRADKIVMILTAPGHRHDVTVAIARFADDPTVLSTIVIEPATSDAAGARSAVPEGFDAQVTFDPWRALRGLWPAVDALRTSATDYPSPRHARLAGSARGVIEHYRGIDPELAMPDPAIFPECGRGPPRPGPAPVPGPAVRALGAPNVGARRVDAYDELLDHVERLLRADVYHN